MTFYRKDFQIYRDWITIIPTIQILTNNPMYTAKSIAIELSWIVFHARFIWMEREK